MSTHDSQPGGPSWLNDVGLLRQEFEGRLKVLSEIDRANLYLKVDEAYRNGSACLKSFGSPVAVETFMGFINGQDLPGDYRGLLHYFYVLGAEEGLLTDICRLLMLERERRIDALFGQRLAEALPSRAQAFRRLRVFYQEYLAGLSLALTDAIGYTTPETYLDLLQKDMSNLRDLYDGLLNEFLDTPLDRVVPPSQNVLRRRQITVTRQLEVFLTRSRVWLAEHPSFAQHLMSSRPMVRGPLDQRGVRTTARLADCINEVTYEVLFRFAQEHFGDKLVQSASARAAIEETCEVVLSIPLRFHVAVVQGARGTGAAFYGSHRLRRDMTLREGGYSPAHRNLSEKYEHVLNDAERLLREEPDVTMDRVEGLFDAHAKDAEVDCVEIWQREYVPQIAATAGWGLADAFLRHGVWSHDKQAHWASEFGLFLSETR